MVGNADSSAERCPHCGGQLRIWSTEDPAEYQAYCRSCGWKGPLKVLVCGGCHVDSLFFRTGDSWRCLWCGHSREDGR